MRWPIRHSGPRSPWTGVGPAALMLTLAGAGVSSIIPGVRAQETAPAAPKPLLAPAAPGADPLRAQVSAPAAPQPAVVVVGRPAAPQPPPTLETPSVSPQEKDGLSSEEQRQLRSQLRDLMKQRADLDSRIAGLRRRLGESDLTLRDYGVIGDNAYLLAPYVNSNRKMTPEERKQAEEAMKQAQEAMRMAQKAMEQARKAMGESGVTIYRDVLPRIEEHLRALEVPNTIPALPDVHVYKWNQDDQKRFEQDWAKQQPEFERSMRDFQARMQKWAEEFEARMRREFGAKGGDRLAPPSADKPNVPAPEKEKDSPDRDKDHDTGGDIL